MQNESNERKMNLMDNWKVEKRIADLFATY